MTARLFGPITARPPCGSEPLLRISWYSRRPGLRQQLVGPEPLFQAVHEAIGAAPLVHEAVGTHLADVQLSLAFCLAIGSEQVDRLTHETAIVGAHRQKE